MRPSSLRFIWLCVLGLACATGPADQTAGENSADDMGVRFFIGQAYPSGRIYLQPFGAGRPPAKEIDRPAAVTFHPLVAGVPGVGPAGHRATLDGGVTDTYIPEVEQMPTLERGPCTLLDYTPRPGARYAESEVLTDFFDRGMPDNCETDDAVARYRTDSPISLSFPVLAIDVMGAEVEADYSPAGRKRPVSQADEVRIREYVEEFEQRFQEAYDVEYDEDVGAIGAISTLANAEIIAEYHFPGLRYTARVSSWEETSIAYHLYRRFILDIVQEGRVVRSYEVVRYQGVLG